MHIVTNLDSHHIIHFGDVFFYSRFRSFSALFLFPLEFLDHHSVSSYESPPYETSLEFDLPIVHTIEKLKTTSVILGYHKGTPRQNLFFEKLLTITLREIDLKSQNNFSNGNFGLRRPIWQNHLYANSSLHKTWFLLILSCKFFWKAK